MNSAESGQIGNSPSNSSLEEQKKEGMVNSNPVHVRLPVNRAAESWKTSSVLCTTRPPTSISLASNEGRKERISEARVSSKKSSRIPWLMKL